MRAFVPNGVPVVLRYDSTYAANVARGLWRAKKNKALVAKVRQELRRVEGRIEVPLVDSG